MVDAAIGGKNGVDVGIYKNMVGTVYQPGFILFDYSFLQTLPVDEWINGFAEIIKHACIKDKLLFNMLEKYTLHEIQADNTLLASLIEQNVALKMSIVTEDEFEKAELNEREAYDLMGVRFVNHPDLRRLFLTDDWEGFPLRKDYVDEINMIKL